MSALITETSRQSTLNFGGFKISPENIIDGPDLLLSERCDNGNCGSAALVRFVKLETRAQLIFCGRHARDVVEKMVTTGWGIDDQTYKAFKQPTFEEDED